MSHQVALIIALAERAARKLATRGHALSTTAQQARLDLIVAGLLEQPDYASASVDLGTAARLVEAAVTAYYP